MIEEKPTLKSNFVGYLGIKNYTQVEQQLIFPRVKDFFTARGISDFKALDEKAGIADVDFQRKNFADFFANFYEYIVNGIHKKNGKIEIPVTYCITLDKSNCSKQCEKTEIWYDDMLLYDQPVFYFIYLDIQEVFAFLKTPQADF